MSDEFLKNISKKKNLLDQNWTRSKIRKLMEHYRLKRHFFNLEPKKNKTLLHISSYCGSFTKLKIDFWPGKTELMDDFKVL